jgi:hypothetical protein
MKKKCAVLVGLLIRISSFAQSSPEFSFLAPEDSFARRVAVRQFLTTSEFLDAAISSVNAFTGLVKKENYRTRITSLNNPTSSDMGFTLENEIQSALKPMLAKARNTNTSKFSEVITSLVTNQGKMPATRMAVAPVNPIFNSLMSLVGTLTVQEKKITREDLDSFIRTTAKYFVQYERLNNANILFDQQMESISRKLKELQFDMRAYLGDLITIVYPDLQREQLKATSLEGLLLQYLDKEKLNILLIGAMPATVNYPSDGVKTAKDITNSLQKLFDEYQKLYTENFQQIRSILADTKSLGKNINARQVDASLKELEELYQDSKNTDVFGLRLATLSERLKNLVATEQLPRQ